VERKNIRRLLVVVSLLAGMHLAVRPVAADDVTISYANSQNATTADFDKINAQTIPYYAGYQAVLADGTVLQLKDPNNPAAGYLMPTVSTQNQTQTQQVHYEALPQTAASKSSAAISASVQSAPAASSSAAVVAASTPVAPAATATPERIKVVLDAPAAAAANDNGKRPDRIYATLMRLLEQVADGMPLPVTLANAGIALLGLWWLQNHYRGKYRVMVNDAGKQEEEWFDTLDQANKYVELQQASGKEAEVKPVS
jgi:hypothetical protein